MPHPAGREQFSGVPKPDQPASPEASWLPSPDSYRIIYGHLREDGSIERIDPYQLAEWVYQERVESLTTAGQLRRPTEITTEAEWEDHCDELSRLYRQTCVAMGLEWPPTVDAENTHS